MSTTVHGELTADGKSIVLMAVGPVEDIAHTARQLQQLTPLVKATDPKGALQCPASWPAIVQLSSIYKDSWRPGPRLTEWITRETLARTFTGGDLTVHIPDGLTPRPYQVEGAQLIAQTGRAMIFDEPRTGKTITTILGLAQAALNGLDVLPILVVCPASVVDPWVETFRRWAPYLDTVAWRGTPAKRRALAGTADVYVASYDTARADANANLAMSPLLQMRPGALVADECHFIKNQQAARSVAVRRLAKHARAFVALSGTPITHNPADLWPTLVCLAPDAWPSRERWINRYCLTAPADYGESILSLHPGTEPEFRVAIYGQHRRVARKDVMAQLPDKVYSTRTVELPPEYRKAYDAMEKTMLAELPDGGEISVMSVLAQLTRLSQLASAPAEVTTLRDEQDGTESVNVTLKAPSWKVDALLEVLAERPGDPVATFAPSAQLIRLAGHAATAAGYRVGYIIGGQSQRERTEARNAFQAGELDLLCCTTGAGGTGITLSAAGTLVFLQRPWSLVESLQAEDRAEGDLDNHQGTEIIDIIAANTIDSRVRSVLRGKAKQLADLLQDPRIVAELLGGASVTRIRKAS